MQLERYFEAIPIALRLPAGAPTRHFLLQQAVLKISNALSARSLWRKVFQQARLPSSALSRCVFVRLARYIDFRRASLPILQPRNRTL